MIDLSRRVPISLHLSRETGVQEPADNNCVTNTRYKHDAFVSAAMAEAPEAPMEYIYIYIYIYKYPWPSTNG